jgi:hypothetical protein
MPVITGGQVVEGGYRYHTSAAPVAGTNEVQTLTIGGTPTGGTFRLSFEGRRTGAITWSATNATLLANMNAAMDAAWGAGAVVAAAGTLTAGIGTVTLTFGANYAKRAVGMISVFSNALTGTAPTLAIAETTPGVDATARGAAPGALLIRDDAGQVRVYINTGTALEPTWTVVGAQT